MADASMNLRMFNTVVLLLLACCTQGRRETTFIESPEYAIFIKLPEFYWMR